MDQIPRWNFPPSQHRNWSVRGSFLFSEMLFSLYYLKLMTDIVLLCLKPPRPITCRLNFNIHNNLVRSPLVGVARRRERRTVRWLADAQQDTPIEALTFFPGQQTWGSQTPVRKTLPPQIRMRCCWRLRVGTWPRSDSFRRLKFPSSPFGFVLISFEWVRRCSEVSWSEFR